MGTAAAVFMMLLPGERIDNRAGLARASNVVQIRRGKSALASEHVTVTAPTFAPEDLLAMGSMPGQRVINGGAAQLVDIRSDFPDFLFRQLLRAHWRPCNTVLDGIEDLRVASAKICAVARYDRWSDLTRTATRSMAPGAMLSIEILAFMNSMRLALKWIHWPAGLGKNRSNRAHQKEPREAQCSIHGLALRKPKAKTLVPDATAKNC
jgi:hypothetical protein